MGLLLPHRTTIYNIRRNFSSTKCPALACGSNPVDRVSSLIGEPAPSRSWPLPECTKMSSPLAAKALLNSLYFNFPERPA